MVAIGLGHQGISIGAPQSSPDRIIAQPGLSLEMANAGGQLDWTVSQDATINRAHQHATNTTRPDQDTGGWVELHESATDRVRTRRSRHRTSRGGLTTKIHTAVDGKGRPLAVVVTGGQRNDQAMLAAVLDEIVVPRLFGGRARSRPDALIAGRAYSSGASRRMLRNRKITAVIPQKCHEIAARPAPARLGRPWPP